MDVFNITIARQQAEVEVIPDCLSISKNKSRIYTDLIDVVMLLVLCCNILFPKKGSNLLISFTRKFHALFCYMYLNQTGSMGKKFFLTNWVYQILRVHMKVKANFFPPITIAYKTVVLSTW